MMTWKESTQKAVRDLTLRLNRKTFSRRELIEFELQNLLSRIVSSGDTPEQTLSRELQEMRDEGMLEFLGAGNYLLKE